MNTIIIVNKRQNLIDVSQVNNFVDKLESLNVSVSKVVLTNCFNSDIANLNLEKCDFVVAFNNEKIKLDKPTFVATDIEECINQINEYLNTLNSNCVLIKTFGLTESQIKAKLTPITSNKSIKTNIYSNLLDCKVVLNFDKIINQNEKQDVISSVFETLKNNIYTNDNFSMYEIACNLLNISKKTCTIIETLTKGNISNNLFQVDLFGNIKMGLVATKLEDFADKLNIDLDTLNCKSEVELVYEIAASVLDTCNTDYVVLVYGTTLDNYCHIAIGDVDGIHIYKNKFSSKSPQLIDTLSKSAIFYLIKKIKQNDLFFNQIIV